jgi:hypothetical protein
MVLRQQILFGIPVWLIRLRNPERIFQTVHFCPLFDGLTIYCWFQWFYTQITTGALSSTAVWAGRSLSLVAFSEWWYEFRLGREWRKLCGTGVEVEEQEWSKGQSQLLGWECKREWAAQEATQARIPGLSWVCLHAGHHWPELQHCVWGKGAVEMRQWTVMVKGLSLE